MTPEQVLTAWSHDVDLAAAARAAGQAAPPLSDEQIQRLRVVLAEPATQAA